MRFAQMQSCPEFWVQRIPEKERKGVSPNRHAAQDKGRRGRGGPTALKRSVEGGEGGRVSGAAICSFLLSALVSNKAMYTTPPQGTLLPMAPGSVLLRLTGPDLLLSERGPTWGTWNADAVCWMWRQRPGNAVGLTWPHTHLNGDSRLPRKTEQSCAGELGRAQEADRQRGAVGNQQKR